MNKLTKFLLAFAAGVCCVFSSFADGSSPDITVATDMISNAQSALTGVLTAAAAAVGVIALAGLAIWGGIAIYGLLKRAFGAGKGR